MISVLAIGNATPETREDLCMAARAFGASEITFTGKKSEKLIKQFERISKKWGGTFIVSFTANWEEYVYSKKNYTKIHLTRYGVPLNKVLYTLKTYKNLLVIVTMMEPMKKVHQLADFNVSITTQPHCTSAAVSVFLHVFYEGRELALHFENAQYKILPNEKGIHLEKIR